MSLSKRLSRGMTSFSHSEGGHGSLGWVAPEIAEGGRQTNAVDLFSLGCRCYFFFTKPQAKTEDVSDKVESERQQGKVESERQLQGPLSSKIERMVAIKRDFLGKFPKDLTIILQAVSRFVN
ncbi:uncharacterized protein LOC143888467 isoform X2 [Tasmannia lanceolata]|uniref:uncharacterized protein LOC143888447 isoform X2 n=1 Tax=Tasmannia lanceolata TaxID=3420 RepID=UPI004062C50B